MNTGKCATRCRKACATRCRKAVATVCVLGFQNSRSQRDVKSSWRGFCTLGYGRAHDASRNVRQENPTPINLSLSVYTQK